MEKAINNTNELQEPPLSVQDAPIQILQAGNQSIFCSSVLAGSHQQKSKIALKPIKNISIIMLIEKNCTFLQLVSCSMRSYIEPQRVCTHLISSSGHIPTSTQTSAK